LRLSERLKHELGKSLEESFGPFDAVVFGSRTDDTKRGGDIDIAIRSNLSRAEFFNRKVRFRTNLIRKGLDLDIDLVQISDASPLLQEEIARSGILLHHSPKKDK